MNNHKSHDTQYIAVFDVGKTNKKLLIYDSSLEIVASTYATFEEFQEDAIFYESLRESAAWFLDSLKEMAAQFPIGAVSVSSAIPSDFW
jgi:sugar (pentulose or hexulose) kinase